MEVKKLIRSPTDKAVDLLVRGSFLLSPWLERLFRSVDMAWFFPVDSQSTCADKYLKVPPIYAYALAMEGLELSPGASLLVLGSGVGYLNALAGHVLGSGGVNHGVDRCGDVVKLARSRVGDFPAPSDFCRPEFFEGAPPSRTYDRIYVSDIYPLEFYSRHQMLTDLLNVGGITIFHEGLTMFKLEKRDFLGRTFFLKDLASACVGIYCPLNISDFTTAVSRTPKNPNDLKDLCRLRIRKKLRETNKPRKERVQTQTRVRRWGKFNKSRIKFSVSFLCSNFSSPFGVPEAIDSDTVERLPIPRTLKKFLYH